MWKELVTKHLQQYSFEKIDLKAVLFDMDGVLYDSMKNHATAWSCAMRDVGMEFLEYEAYLNEGRKGSDTINGAFAKYLNRQATEKEKQDIYQLKTKHFEALGDPVRMPFALELLTQLREKGLELFVVTGSAQPALIGNLQKDFPKILHQDHIISSLTVKNGKPSPEPYLTALEKGGLKAWEAIVVENAPLGVASSSAAQLFTVGVNTGPLPDSVLSENGANVVLDSMEHLQRVWNEMEEAF